MTDLKSAVLSELSKGKQNAITGEVLCWRLGRKDSRAIRLAILDLINEDKIPICSLPKNKKRGQAGGYFIAASLAEVTESLKILRYGYGMEIFRHYKSLKIAAQNEFSGQLSLKI